MHVTVPRHPDRHWGGVFLLIVALVVNFGLVFLFYMAGLDGHPVARTVINIAVPLVLLGFLFRLVTNPLILHFGNMDGENHGSARFATDKETAALARTSSGLLIGRDGKTGKPLRYDGPAHLLTMAPTRTGKGVGTIIPNLLTADRSVICIDPKGENARIAGRARKKFGPVHVLDPFGQVLRARFRDVQGNDLNQPRDQTPGEAADFLPISAEEQARRRKQVSTARWLGRAEGLGTPGPEYGVIDELWVTGKITREERRSRIDAMMKTHKPDRSMP